MSEASAAGDKCLSEGEGVARVVVEPTLLERRFIRELGFKSAGENIEGAFLLGEHAGALDLRPPGEHGRRGIQANFPPDRKPPDRKPPGRRSPGTNATGAGRNPLIRAFGKRIDVIFDLTAGLGSDAYRLAHAGFPVRAFERDAAVYAVLASGWKRAQELASVPSAIVARLSFVHGEGFDQIASLEGPNIGVYIDPMYPPPPRRRSAKPKRELQVLRALLGGQSDAASLVERARKKAARVVVKRPHHADPLVPGASFEIETKLVRFDVYVNPERMETSSGE